MLSFRPIRPEDDAAIAAIIQQVLPEFGAEGPGFALLGPEVDRMCAAYSVPGAAYFVVVEEDGRIMGGGGLAALDGGEPGICELRKMYFLPQARGKGLGEALLRHCLEVARNMGYRSCYLETLTGMDQAIRLYTKLGFQPLCSPLGRPGHCGCDHWFAMELK